VLRRDPQAEPLGRICQKRKSSSVRWYRREAPSLRRTAPAAVCHRTADRRTSPAALVFVLLLGISSFFADFTYQGFRRI
jgi:hypothetical protein